MHHLQCLALELGCTRLPQSLDHVIRFHLLRHEEDVRAHGLDGLLPVPGLQTSWAKGLLSSKHH